MVMKKAELTAEELAEFTITNCVAFDLYRSEAKAIGQVPPCWLCLSVEAKEEARKRFFEAMGRRVGQTIVCEADFLRLLPDGWGGREVDVWKALETSHKYERDVCGNPRAFFAE
jgi:hypothetical protein